MTVEQRLAYSIPEAAAQLDVSDDTVYRLIRTGALVARRLRPKSPLRITHADLTAYVDGLAAATAATPQAAPAPVAETPPVQIATKRRRKVVRLLDITAVSADDAPAPARQGVAGGGR